MIRRLSNNFRVWALAAVALLAAACGTLGAPAHDNANEPPALETTEYRLGAGDELHISVFGRPELTGQFSISTQGNIAYPLVGDLPASGKTLAELTASLSDLLRQGYVRDPAVSIDITRYRPFFILGEVGHPGTYPYSPSLTVMSAVATAGGFTYRANSQRVFIKHDDENNEREYTLSSTTPVQPGDIVRIPERRF